ncbi:MAG: RES domain-containing protein [Acidobacteriota bacterium]|nr:RES domain-containing protein [Acidobacteriota bacterium]
MWRIATAAHAAFDGEGARRYGSRWTPRGVAAVYASATLSLAALERFVHTDPDLEPADLVAMLVDVTDGFPIHSLEIGQLPADWRHYPAPDALGRLGGEWLAGARTAILAVPSVVIPHEWNYVLNPKHADFRRLAIGQPEPFSFDPRMRAKRRPR